MSSDDSTHYLAVKRELDKLYLEAQDMSLTRDQLSVIIILIVHAKKVFPADLVRRYEMCRCLSFQTFDNATKHKMNRVDSLVGITICQLALAGLRVSSVPRAEHSGSPPAFSSDPPLVHGEEDPSSGAVRRAG